MYIKIKFLFYALLISAFMEWISYGCKKENKETNVIPPINFNPSIAYGSLTDQDSNTYKTVTIGNKTWMAENLKTKKYRTGDIIPTVSLKGAWKILGSGAYCNYNNDEKTTNIYGRLYNWYAINDKRNLAPAGWHVATDSEWKSLIALAGWHGTEKLRESGIMHWEWGDTDYNGTDDFGFTALPGGERYFYTVGSLNFDDIFCYMGSEGYWWTSTDSTSSLAWEYNISILIYRDLSPKQFGFSVRCVKDN